MFLPVVIVLGESHLLHLLLPVARLEHLEGFNGFGRLERDFLALVQALASEVGLGSEDLLPRSPAALGPVANPSFVLGFLVLGTEALEEGLVDGELVGGEAVGRRPAAERRRASEERTPWEVEMVVAGFGIRVRVWGRFGEGEEEMGMERSMEDLHCCECRERKWREQRE